ncbi:MAG TPA: TonB-dependent receptor [Terracidiphilus sp.]|jgi:outer membrane receptor protein involved in Fe transport
MKLSGTRVRSLLLAVALGAGFAVTSTLAPNSVVAQTSLGTLTGTVRDTSGAVLVNAAVRLTNLQTGDVRAVNSDSLGSYRFDALAAGAYTLDVESTGFQKFNAKGVKIVASTSQSFDVVLQTGQVSETVEVSADAAVLLDKENGSLSGNIPSEQLAKLPIFSLNPIEVLTTVPGVQVVSNSGMSNGYNLQVSGARPRSNNFMIDGEEINDVSIGGQAVQPQIPDMYADTVVYTHNAPAEFGRASGGVVNLITKSGSNTFHGSAWELYSGSGLNAMDGQTRQVATDSSFKARYDQHQFGFTAGGPIWKDKLFAFGAAQWTRYYGNETPSEVTLPNAQGIDQLKALAAGSGVTATNAALMLQYLSNASYLNDFIDFGPVKTVSLGDACDGCSMGLDLFRRPNVAASSPDTQWTYRIDFTPHQKDTFSARYLHDRGSLTPDFFTNGGALPGFDTYQGGPSELGQGTWTHIFTPNFLNEFRVSETRISFYFAPLASTVANPLYTAPNLSFGSSDVTTLGFNQNFPQGRGEDQYQFQDTISWTHGRQTVRAGVDIGRRIETDVVSLNANGSLNFAKGGSGVSPEGNFLLNQLGPSGSATKTYGNTRLDPHSWRSGAFVQDDVKVNPDLTVNLGVRYDYFTSPENALPYPAIDPNNPFAPVDSVYKVTPDKNNWAPRLGFAYTPHQGPFANGNTVVRGGFGIFFDTDFTNIMVNEAQNSPDAVSGTLISTQGNGLGDATSLIGQIPNVLNPLASVLSVTKNLVSPYTIEYNLGVEHQFPLGIAASATYVGSRGVKLFANQQYNSFDPNTGERFEPTRGAINARGNFAASDYNGLEVGGKRNFSHGIALYGSYVYSKALDNGSEVFTPDAEWSSYGANLVPGGRRNEWGNSAYDHRNYGAITYVWTPNGLRADNHGTDLVLSALTRHWTISGSSHFQSGAYGTVNIAGLDINGDGNNANDRPLVGNPSAPMDSVAIDAIFFGLTDAPGTYIDMAAANNNQVQVVDPSTSRWIVPLLNGYSNKEIGRNSFRNPGIMSNDVALEKALPTSLLHLERGQFILRAEAQNIANHNNVGILDVDVLDAGSTGYLNTQQARSSAGRQLRFWAKFVF